MEQHSRLAMPKACVTNAPSKASAKNSRANLSRSSVVCMVCLMSAALRHFGDHFWGMTTLRKTARAQKTDHDWTNTAVNVAPYQELCLL
jgi:hypothetical protein